MDIFCNILFCFFISGQNFKIHTHTFNATNQSLMHNVQLNSDDEEEEGGFGCSRTRVCVAPPIGGQSGGNNEDM